MIIFMSPSGQDSLPIHPEEELIIRTDLEPPLGGRGQKRRGKKKLWIKN
jgi:hypothetical protein